MIGINLICSNFMIFSLKLNNCQLNILPSQVYTPLPSPWGLLDGFTEPLFRDVVIPLMERHLCSFLATVQVPYPTEHSASCRWCFLSTNFRYLMMNN